jgi:putative ABC transport system permease protein
MNREGPREVLRDAAGALTLLRGRSSVGAIVLATIALGIGAPTAIFSVVHAVLLRPLPYPQADRLVRFHVESRRAEGGTFDAIPAASALQWAGSTSTLAGLAVFGDRMLTLRTAEGPFRLSGVAAAPVLFDLMQVRPVLGQAFDPATTDPGQIVLSHRAWRRYFASDLGIVGRSVTLDAGPYRVLGVMPERFRFPSADTEFWVPMILAAGEGRGMLLPSIARVRPDSSLAAAVEEGRRILDRDSRGQSALVLHARTLEEEMVGGIRRLLWMLMASVGFVCVIATANVALLLLLRGASRRREFSLRLAVGATRGRLVGQLLAEGFTFAAIGGAAGIGLAAAMLGVLVRVAPVGIARLEDASIDGTALLFACGLTMATSLVFGVLSAGKSIAFDLPRALGAAEGAADPGRGASPRRRLRLLAGVEIALTVVLVTGAGLLIRAFVGAALIDHGFDTADAVALQVSMPSARYPGATDRFAMHEQLIDRLASLDGVDRVGVTVAMPNRQPSARLDFNPNGPRLAHDPLSMQIAEVRSVSEGFLEAMGIPLLAGRTFRREDREGAEPVIVISESLAKLHFGDRSALGEVLYSGRRTVRIVGVVGDVRAAAPRPQLSPSAYLPLRQDGDVFRWFGSLTIVVRAARAASLVPSLRTMVLAMDREMPPFNVRTLDEETSRLVAGPRFSASALTVFAVVALLLAAIGVYGVVAYSASQRTHEIGVRVALGATRGQVLWLVIREGLMVVGLGLVAGAVAAAGLARSLAGLVHDVRPADPIALTGVVLVLGIVGLVAVCIPGQRAARVNAVDALRME